MDKSFFDIKEMLIYSEKKEPEKSFEQFLQEIPENYNGLIFYEGERDTIGRSRIKTYMGKSV